MPEPNLSPLRLNLKTTEDSPNVLSVPSIKNRLPELPEESRNKLIEEFQLRPEAAIQLVNEPLLLGYFEEILSNKSRNPTKVANLIINDLLTALNKRKIDVENCPITTKHLSDLIDLLLKKQISVDTGRKVLEEIIENPNSSSQTIVEEKGWFLNTNEEEISKKCQEVLENNPKLVKQYKEGKTKVFKALLGILGKSTENKIDMSVASKILEDLLKK